MAVPASALARLLRPRSIAVVGGGAWCEAVLAQCRAMRFAGTVYAVHPHRESVAGFRAWPSVADLPESPDATFVGVNRDASVEVLGALAARAARAGARGGDGGARGRNAGAGEDDGESDNGVGGAVCFANGFAEAGDDARQRALLEAAGDVALLGPNCYGYVNALDGVALWPDQHGCERVERGVALVTQSSNIALNLSMQRRGLPLAYVVTTGNQAQQGFAAIGETLLDDPRVSALGLHVEGFGDVRAFERLAARAARLGKPVVVLKAGRSAAARRATLSHTASLAGSDAGADALLRRLGVARVDSLPVLVETLKLSHAHGASVARAREDGATPRTVRLASMSCSGGEAALVADAARDATGDATSADARARVSARLVFPDLDGPTRHELTAALGPRVALANPLDYDTGIWRDGAALERVYRAMATDDIDLTLLVLDLPREDRCDARDWDRPIAALERAARDQAMRDRAKRDRATRAPATRERTGRDRTARTATARFALVATLPENLPETLARRLLDAGVAPLAGIDDALAAIRAAAGADDRAASPRYVPILPANERAGGTERVHDGRDEADARTERETLSEHAAKRALAAHGLPVPRGERALDAAAAGGVAASIGFPVVLKGEGLAHKSDAGAVALGLADAAAVTRAARAMPCRSFLVEEMIGNGVVELLVGVVRDPAHGFVLTIGAGGVLTEILADSVSRLLPVTARDVDAALDELRVAPVIAGARGRPGADRDALVRAVLAVQSFVLARSHDIVELEVNPLLVTPETAVALDALLVLERDTPESPPPGDRSHA